MKPRVDLRELSNRLTSDIQRFEREEVPVTQESMDGLRSMEELLKRQRLAYKELYVYFCHQLDVALQTVDDKITRLESRLPELPGDLPDLEEVEIPDDLKGEAIPDVDSLVELDGYFLDPPPAEEPEDDADPDERRPPA